jgi:hypothetical protein
LELNTNESKPKDIVYTLNDSEFNGISEFDIKDMIKEIKVKLDCNISIYSSEIAKLLSSNEEIKLIARKYDSENHEEVKFGIIPKDIIENNITILLMSKMEREI